MQTLTHTYAHRELYLKCNKSSKLDVELLKIN